MTDWDRIVRTRFDGVRHGMARPRHSADCEDVVFLEPISYSSSKPSATADSRPAGDIPKPRPAPATQGVHFNGIASSA